MSVFSLMFKLTEVRMVRVQGFLFFFHVSLLIYIPYKHGTFVEFKNEAFQVANKVLSYH